MVGNAEDNEDKNFDCPLCSVKGLTEQQFLEHKSQPQHKIKWLKHWYSCNKTLLAQNKNGVDITLRGNPEDATLDSNTGHVEVYLCPNSHVVVQLRVFNSGKEAVLLQQVQSLTACSFLSLKDTHGVCKGEKYVRLSTGIEYLIECQVTGQMTGVTQVPVTFQFKPDSSSELFFIVRTLQINIQDDVTKACSPTTLFQRPTPGQVIYEKNNIVPGVPLPRENSLDKLSKKTPLKEYNYSPKLELIARKRFDPSKVSPKLYKQAKEISDMLKTGLQPDNYSAWFRTMLWAEEMQMKMDIRYYSMEDAPLTLTPPRDNYGVDCVELEVPGLAENRPSVLKGDTVLVTFKEKKTAYAGVVHRVSESKLCLAFGQEFMGKFIDKMRVNVMFEFNRYPLRVYHRALDIVETNSLTHLIFPTTPLLPPQSTGEIVPFNRNLKNNPEQMAAVRSIVSGSSLPAPYIVFGPPGTGKTVTIVEAITQIIRLQPSCRVLVCTPSNSAADLLASRLLQYSARTQMFRMYSASRPISSIPENLHRISNINGDYLYFPDDSELKKYKVIVCTMVTAARVVASSLGRGHFTHVFLDECGHSMEPESLVSLTGLVNPSQRTQVVLAGDPYQLGPVIRNVQCYSGPDYPFGNNGLDKSYLERLMESSLYKSDPITGFNPRVVTKLLMNYRSHPDIIKLPNDLFYNSELKACGDELLWNSLASWKHLVKKGFPLVFQAVKGKDQREGTSPSFFNAQEVSAVVNWVKKLLDTKSPKITGKDIGVITPYRRQVEKIRKQLERIPGTKALKVGSPEEFQGDERLVVLISTVRASQDHMADDLMMKLGFLRNPKRFNVAVTRAEALLIVIGAPEILSLDKYWGQLLSYIQAGGGYRGHAFKQNDDLDDILARFNSLSLRPVLGEEVSRKEVTEAPEWRAEY